VRAVILAGGKGTRLWPYTSVLPKPLLPVGDAPILSIVLRQLARSGVTRATLAVGHMAEMFPQVLGKSTGALRLDYVRERSPLGTAAPLRHVRGLSSTFLVLNGDILTDLDFRALVRHHRLRRAAATIATFRRKVNVDFGVIETHRDGWLAAYHEKPSLAYRVSMGIYVFEPEVLRHIPARGAFDFPDLIQELLQAGQPVASYPFSGRWLDIGRPDDFLAAQTEFSRNRRRYV
jgi:NDP-mannose synthase